MVTWVRHRCVKGNIRCFGKCKTDNSDHGKKQNLLSIRFVFLYTGADSGIRCKIIFWERNSKLRASPFRPLKSFLILYLLEASYLYIYMACAAVSYSI
jgi:hypothetical protein